MLEEEGAALGQIVELRFFAGQTMEAIAEILDLSIGTLKNHVRQRSYLLVSTSSFTMAGGIR